MLVARVERVDVAADEALMSCHPDQVVAAVDDEAIAGQQVNVAGDVRAPGTDGEVDDDDVDEVDDDVEPVEPLLLLVDDVDEEVLPASLPELPDDDVEVHGSVVSVVDEHAAMALSPTAATKPDRAMI